ncbi:hypothetical protein FHG89_04015 [Micromonospora orduensis]|uniref:UspA domain-containing protein n=1 Tax=Micromonospora orduensis TaxID=1420891 RepID=A0A5C4QYP4_9ACTN|nr:universal stress protein [Micromonospora orduensis]TNH31140.1 hypothetical protein FHG89_04015 [Micromonospora orduensis]
MACHRRPAVTRPRSSSFPGAGGGGVANHRRRGRWRRRLARPGLGDGRGGLVRRAARAVPRLPARLGVGQPRPGNPDRPAGTGRSGPRPAVASTRARLGGDRIALRVLPGRPGHLFVEAASDADLLIVGPPAASAPRGLGSTAHYVAAHAPCPVVVVRPLAGGREAAFAGHVVVGVDDSAAGRAALEFGFGYADTHVRPLAAVHVTADRCQDVPVRRADRLARAGLVTGGVVIAAEDNVDRWLADAGHDELVDPYGDSGVLLRRVGGPAGAVSAPAEQTFWLASAAGTGTVVLDRALTDGRFAVVLATG